MSIMNKLFTAVRGAFTEAGEAAVDSQAMRILDQEMKDAKKHLDEAKENLAKVMAEQMGVEREVKRLTSSVSEHEGYAIQAMEKGDDTLALQIAEKIAEFSNDLEAQQSVLDSYNQQISTLKQTIKNTDRNIQSMEREISVVKTTESVQKASSAAAAKFSGTNSSMKSATDSLERIKNRQTKKTDQMNAALELQKSESGDELKDKMKAAGIISSSASGNDILAKLKAKQGK
ncbi:MAG: PspA/IM30 family protein [Methylococcales bacterium]|jgi:phage shock protein A|nr:PspA/IM30 family protein [Methylococcales bacterium]MBT7410018.1 PspA/IM30 family protein [Methylococcales bacterium]